MLRERSIQVCDFQVRFLEHAKNLFLARNSTKQRIKNEIDCVNMNLKPWSSYDSGIYDYQHRCQHVLVEEGFVNLVNKKTNALALDAFSPFLLLGSWRKIQKT